MFVHNILQCKARAKILTQGVWTPVLADRNRTKLIKGTKCETQLWSDLFDSQHHNLTHSHSCRAGRQAAEQCSTEEK